MAIKLRVISARQEDPFWKFVLAQYVQSVAQLEGLLGKGEFTASLELTKGGEVFLSIRDSSGEPVLDVKRSISLSVSTISHEILDISPSFRGLGISSVVNAPTTAIAEKAGIRRVAIEAGAEDGGFVWLRKGFVPSGGARWISERLKKGGFELESSIVGRMEKSELLNFLLSEDFKKFAPAFRGSTWKGEADLEVPQVVAAMRGEKIAPIETDQSTKALRESTANEKIRDHMIGRQIALMRYSMSLSNQAIGMLNASEKEIRAILAEGAEGGLLSQKDWEKMRAMLGEVGSVRSSAWQEVNELLTKSSEELASSEVVQINDALHAVVPVEFATVLPSTRQLNGIAASRPFAGRVLADWISTMQDEDIVRISSAVQLGMLAGESTAEITSRVMGTKALRGTDGVTEDTRRNVTAITRTMVNNVSNQVRSEFFRMNDDIVAKEIFVSTLDARTTLVCASNDGKEFPLGEGPVPPLHYGCRSLRIASLDGVQLGDRPANPTTEKLLVEEFAEINGFRGVRSREDLPRGTKGEFDKFSRMRKRELIGTIPAKTSYSEWLKKQSPAFQDEILGPSRGSLFREGGLSLDKFVARDGSGLTLEQIARSEADAFRKAGLSK